MAMVVGPTLEIHAAIIEEAKTTENQRYEDEKYEINRHWDAVAADLDSARMVGCLSVHERTAMRTFITSHQSLDHTRCSISHCRKMIDIKSIGK